MNTYPQYSDEQLMLMLKDNDKHAFTELYDRYWEKLFVVAVRRLENESEAKEIVQEVFFKLWKRKDSITISKTVSAYLATAVKYEILNLFRSRRHERRVKMSALDNSAGSISDETENTIEYNALITQLAESVKALPEKCRLVYQLSREEHYSQKEIASTLGIAEKTVEAHLSTAIRKLRAALGLIVVLFLKF